jgi:hypothetical protein
MPSEYKHKYDPDTDRCKCGAIIVWAWGREMCEILADQVYGKTDPRLKAFKKSKPRCHTPVMYD